MLKKEKKSCWQKIQHYTFETKTNKKLQIRKIFAQRMDRESFCILNFLFVFVSNAVHTHFVKIGCLIKN